MTPERFAQTYLRYEENIKKVLNSRKIYDEDLLHDTYIALCEHAQNNKIDDFVNAYVEFYKKRYNWRKKQESQIEHYDYAQFAELEIFDESVGEEALNERLDNDRTTYREQCLARLPELIEYYLKHPHPDERNHRRACQILRLYLDGLSEREISRKLGISQQAINQSIRRIRERLKSCHPSPTI